MKKLSSLIALSFFAINSFAQTITNLVSDPAHSRIQFSVVHIGIADITGNFEKSNLHIEAVENNFVNSKIHFEVDVNSINTHIEARDNHLKSADFFDAEKYPTMKFSSTSIKKTKKNQYKVTGNLNLHGVTKPVTLALIYRGSTTNPRSKAVTHGYQFIGSIKRSDFGVGGNFPEAAISDKVSIKGDFEMLIKK